MTAAHCGVDATDVRIYYGAHNLSQATDKVQMKRFVPHENYDFPNYDIGIIEVEPHFEFSDKVGTVCLPDIFSDKAKVDDQMIGLGWGRTENNR